MPIMHLAQTGAPQKGGPFIGINTICNKLEALWLERLSYDDAGSHQKVLSSNLGLAIQQLENSVNPGVNGHFLNQGRP